MNINKAIDDFCIIALIIIEIWGIWYVASGRLTRFDLPSSHRTIYINAETGSDNNGDGTAERPYRHFYRAIQDIEQEGDNG